MVYLFSETLIQRGDPCFQKKKKNTLGSANVNHITVYFVSHFERQMQLGCVKMYTADHDQSIFCI